MPPSTTGGSSPDDPVTVGGATTGIGCHVRKSTRRGCEPGSLTAGACMAPPTRKSAPGVTSTMKLGTGASSAAAITEAGTVSDMEVLPGIQAQAREWPPCAATPRKPGGTAPRQPQPAPHGGGKRLPGRCHPRSGGPASRLALHPSGNAPHAAGADQSARDGGRMTGPGGRFRAGLDKQPPGGAHPDRSNRRRERLLGNRRR